MSNPEWYAAKTIYKHYRVEDSTPLTVFEERVVLFHADDFDDAIEKAEAEAEEYCGTDGETVYLGFVNVFHLCDDTVGHGTEIYSLMRESELSDADYLDRWCRDGKERSQTWQEATRPVEEEGIGSRKR